MKTIQLTLTEKELDTILLGLEQLQYKIAAPVISSIVTQFKLQEIEQKEEVTQ